MAANRPVVLVFQEFAQLTVPATTPVLNCLVAGPAYWIQDFPEDRDNIKLTATYGIPLTTSATGVTASVPAMAPITDAPGNKPGADVVPSSVRVFAGAPVVELAFGTGTSTADATEITATSANFVTAGVQPGDDVMVTDSDGTGDLRSKVVSVTATTVVIADEIPSGWAAGASTKLRFERTVNDGELTAPQPVAVVTDGTNTITIQGNLTLPVFNTVTTIVNGNPVSSQVSLGHRKVLRSDVYVAYTSFRKDLQALGTVTSSTIEATVGRIDSRNPLAVGLSVACQNTGTTVQYFGIGSDNNDGYINMFDAVEGRPDVYAIVPLTSDIAVLAAAKLRLDNLASPTYALTNGVDQKFRVCIGQVASLPEFKTISETLPDGNGEYDGSTQVNSADASPAVKHMLRVLGTNFISRGVEEGSILSIVDNGSGADWTGQFTVKRLVNATTLELTGALPGASPVGDGGPPLTITIAVGAEVPVVHEVTDCAYAATALSVLTVTSAEFITQGWLPNDTVTIVDDSAEPLGWDGVYKVAQVISNTAVMLDDVVFAAAPADGVSITIQKNALPAATHLIGACSAAAPDKVYSELVDANATFVADGVIPGDLIQIPKHPGAAVPNYADVDSWVVNTVVSNTRLRIAYTPGVKNGPLNPPVELPYGATRTAPVELIDNTFALPYRVVRALDKDGQVEEIISVATTLAHRRIVSVWPDLCDVADLRDGSLPRNADTPTERALAVTQPGKYLACTVGGMTAGLPSQHGFTNLGIAGISRIYNGSDRFSARQMSRISNAGHFTFQQDTPQSLPYCIHQLTTDVQTLQTGEYSMVKNFDFVCIFLQKILGGFLGQWNVNPETIGVMGTAVRAGVSDLRSRVLPRIGAPIIDGEVSSIAQHDDYPDRIELFVECDFPAPLNTVGLHVVSR